MRFLRFFVYCALAALYFSATIYARRLRQLEIRRLLERVARARELRARARREEARQHAPDAVQALHLAHLAFASSGQWSGLLELGDMYRKGSYPAFRPDPEMALTVFRAACRCPDPAVSGAAQAKYIECRLDPVVAQDVAGRGMPRQYGSAAVALAEQRTAGADQRHFARPVAVPRAVRAQTQTPNRVPRVAMAVTSDAQNVHDHGITTGLRRALAAAGPSDNAFEEVLMHVLESEAPAERKADAIAVLDSLSSEEHSALGGSERDALNAVWADIGRLDDEIRANVKDTLVQQLASGVERGSVVCSTGKIARIMGALDGVREPVNKPMWAVREELGSLASKIRDDDGSAETFKAEASRVYVMELGMSEKLIGPMVDEYALGFDA